MRIVLLLASTLLLSTQPAAAEKEVFRCEGRDGRVTYSDEACPAVSRSVRKLDNAPLLALPPAKDAPRDAREAGRIVQGRTDQRIDPYVEDRRLDEQIATQRRLCEDLSRQMQYSRQDLASAAADQRASAELALRRAEDQYRLHCRRR